MNAQEAKQAAEDFLKSGAEAIYKKIENAARKGSFSVSVEYTDMNDVVKKIIEADGYMVRLVDGDVRDRFSRSYYNVSWT